MAEAIRAQGEADEERLQAFGETLFYQPVDTASAEDFGALKEKLSGIDSEWNTQGNYLYYLSTPPHLFAGIVEKLGSCGLEVRCFAFGYQQIGKTESGLYVLLAKTRIEGILDLDILFIRLERESFLKIEVGDDSKSPRLTNYPRFLLKLVGMVEGVAEHSHSNMVEVY